MRSIASLFGRSPFVPLQEHMEKVAECVAGVSEAIEAYERGDAMIVSQIAERISGLENEADQIKYSIRENLPRGLFMPVDRGNLLNILHIQDGIANRAEDVVVVLTFKQARTLDSFKPHFDRFVAKCLETFEGAREIVAHLDTLLESGFGGTEAAQIREMVARVEGLEHDTDVIQRELLRELLAHEDELSYGDFFLWTRTIREIGQLADRADHLARAVWTTLEVK